MATVNGPNGGDSRGAVESILETDMRCHRVSYARRGQAIVETALLLPILMLLVMGTADLARVFYYSIAITNAAREAARQGTYFDPTATPPTNTFDSTAAVFEAARHEVPVDISLSLATSATQCLPGAPSSWGVYYPTDPNTGFVYICFDGSDSLPTAQSTIQVTILYNYAPVTPLASVVGADTVHLEASTTMQVQTQQ